MTPGSFQIRQYLAPPSPGFWRWDKDGEAIVWADGAVLAFRMELVDVLEELAVDGLPRLSAVLLVMAAAKRSWGDGQRAVTTLSSLAGQFEARGRTVPPALLPDVLLGLAAVHEARGELADEPQVLLGLPALILSDVQRCAEKAIAPAIVEALRAGPGQRVLEAYGGTDTYDDFIASLKALRDRLGDISADGLRLRAATGLDELPEPAPEEIELAPLPSRVRTLIEQLRHDEEYAAVGRLARALMAAIHLPRAVGDPQHMPLGGVSDITNRGALDRLLISELAHDDLTLAVRVVNNEALYLRREEPPSTPTRQRHVLLDTGVRMWGVPRVLATSAAMALLASSQSSETFAWTADRGDLAPAELGDREGLIAQLARLDTPLDPAALLEPLAEAIAAKTDDPCADVVIVTSAAAAGDPAFLRGVRELLPHQLYVIGVQRDGAVSVANVTGAGVRTMSALRLDLDDVMHVGEKRPQAAALDPSLPAILKVRPFPLRLPGRLDPRGVWLVGAGPALSLSRDGRLLLWDVAQVRGGLELANDLTEHQLHWADTNGGSTTRALVGVLAARRLAMLTIDLHSHRVERVALELGKDTPRGATVHRDHVLVFHRRLITALDPLTGAEVARRSIDADIKETQGRLIRTGRETWRMVSFDGQSILVEQVATPPVVIGCFECRLLDAPVAIDRYGVVWTCQGHGTSTARSCKRMFGWAKAGQWLRLRGVSRDGQRFAVQHSHDSLVKTSVFQIEVDRLVEMSAYKTDHPWPLEYPAWRLMSDRALRTRLDGVIIFNEGGVGPPQLGLAGPKGNLALSPGEGGLVLRSTVGIGEFHEFQPIDGPPGAGFKLRAATWPSGSRVVLDSRGLLHLQPADVSIPEATMVLSAAQHVSGWLSDGRCWGDPYHIGDARRADDWVVVQSVIHRFLRQLG